MLSEKLLEEKDRKLKKYIRSLGSVAVAFSGGVDSTFLLKTAHDVLGEKAMAVTARSCSFPERELNFSMEFCRREGIRQVIVDSEELKIEGFSRNPVNRCYLCKKELFQKFLKVAEEDQISCVAEGSNMDDNGDYRPGLAAVAELQIKSPLREAELYKKEIRELSRDLLLPTWDKPSFACLASRFEYGETITEEKLRMVGQAEQLLLDKGFYQVRCRIHGTMARIEVLPSQFPLLIQPEIREEVVRSLKAYGFSYVSMDLQGYRTGSMNETISETQERKMADPARK